MKLIEYLFLHVRKRIAVWQGGGVSSGIIPAMIRNEVIALLRGRRGSILDVGCGEGFMVRKFGAQDDIFFVGADISLSQVYAAQKQVPLARLVVADGRELPFKDNTFATVILLNVSVNMTSPEAFYSILKEVKRVLINGGQLFFDYRRQRSLFNSVRFRCIHCYDRTVARITTYNDADIRQVIQELGFTVKRVYRLFINSSQLVWVKK